MMNASEILAIREPEFLFTGDPLALEREYKKLRVEWHPDHNSDPKATEVFQHLTELHTVAVEHLKNGIWSKPNYLSFLDLKTAKSYEIHYVKKHKIELGYMYISKTLVTFCIEKDNKDLFDNALNAFKSFKYSSNRMEEEIAKYLPKVKITLETKGYYVLILEKNPDLILLRDLFDCYKQKLDPKHTAWILSSLYNLSCYFDYSGVHNNDVGLDTYFVSPEKHGGALLGGWWYAAKKDSKLLAVPERVLQSIPDSVLASKQADMRIPLELIRRTGRELILPESRDKVYLLRVYKDCPKPLKAWFMSVSVGKPIEEYENWHKMLIEAFGPRKFTKMEVKFEDVYPQ